MIEITRGDTAQFKFQRKDNDGNPILSVATKVYFTIKKHYSFSNFVLQKTIDDMTFDEDGYYHFTINPQDTNELSFGEYEYDIEVIVDDYKQTISKGVFKITKEVTHANNEV